MWHELFNTNCYLVYYIDIVFVYSYPKFIQTLFVTVNEEDACFELTIRFGGKFIHMPKARYVGGFSFVIADVGGSMMGRDLVSTFLGVHGIGGIKGFYWDDDGGFVYINDKMWPLLWTRAVVNMGKKLTIYCACDVYPADIELQPADTVIDGDRKSVV